MNTISETIYTLEEFNKWRRGDETITMPDPFDLGVDIDDAVRLLREHITLQSEFDKMALSAAARLDRNVELRRRAAKAEAECREQARLLGISGQREAALLGKIEQLERELTKAKATIEDICTGGRLTCDQCLETMPCNCGHSPRRL